jgi:hypothetical protein
MPARHPSARRAAAPRAAGIVDRLYPPDAPPRRPSEPYVALAAFVSLPLCLLAAGWLGRGASARPSEAAPRAAVVAPAPAAAPTPHGARER